MYTLKRGLEAMEGGDHRAALTLCRDSARWESVQGHALTCWLSAALHLSDWPAALEAARQLADRAPTDPLYHALRADLESRTGLDVAVDDLHWTPELAWACIRSRCAYDQGPAEGSGVTALLRALLAVTRGDLALARQVLAPDGGVAGGALAGMVRVALGLAAIDTPGATSCPEPEAADFRLQEALFRLPASAGWLADCGPSLAGAAPPLVAMLRASQGLPRDAAQAADGRRELGLLLDALSLRGQPPERVASAFEAAAVAWPGSAPVNLDCAAAWLAAGNTDRAGRCIERARLSAPSSDIPVVLDALVRLMEGDPEGFRTRVESVRGQLPPSWHEFLARLQ